MEETYLRKAVKGTVVVLLLGSIAHILGYSSRVALARNLPIEQYGLFYAMLFLIIFLTMVRDMGLQSAAVKFIAEASGRKDYSKIKTITISYLIFLFIFSTILVIIFVIIAEFLSINYFKTEVALGPFKILLLYLLVSPLLLSTRAFLRGMQDMKGFSLVELTKNAFVLILIFVFFKLGFSLLAPIYAYIFGSLLAFVVLIIPASKYFFIFKYKMKDFWQTTKQLFVFGTPMIFVNFGEMMVSYIDILMLTYFASLVAVGIYSAISPTAMIFLFFGSGISAVLFPMVSELWSKGDKDRIVYGLRGIYTYILVLVVPIIFSAIIYADKILFLIFGSEFVAGSLAFRILLFGMIFYIVATLNNSTISAIGKPAITAKIILTIAALNFGLNIILIPLFGITGAAIATTISYMVALVLTSSKLRKQIPIVAPWGNWIKTIFSGFVFIFIVHIFMSLPFFNLWFRISIALLVAGFIYIKIILFFGVVNKRKVKNIIKQVLVGQHNY